MDGIEKMGSEKGFTLIETLIALAILAFVMTVAIQLFLQSMEIIARSKIHRKAAACAGLLVEYLEGMPPDVIFGAYSGTKCSGRFDQAESFYDLPDFLTETDPENECYEMSQDTNTNLAFEICPACEYGCVESTPGACSGPGASVQCIYKIMIRMSWNTPFTADKIYQSEYNFDRFTGTIDDCLSAGCPASQPGAGLSVIPCNM